MSPVGNHSTWAPPEPLKLKQTAAPAEKQLTAWRFRGVVFDKDHWRSCRSSPSSLEMERRWGQVSTLHVELMLGAALHPVEELL